MSHIIHHTHTHVKALGNWEHNSSCKEYQSRQKGAQCQGVGKDGLQGAHSLALWSGEIFRRWVMLAISNRVQYLRV